MPKFENANEASALTDEQRKAVAEALGYEVDDEQIREAIETHKDEDTGTLVKELKWKEEAFKRAGGRGVELADEIDSLRIALSARDVTRRPSS
jgi:ATP-dependent protease HslVU (ClpYQ) ATPase subunit